MRGRETPHEEARAITEQEGRGRVVEVELEDGPPCKDCGTIGPHYCVGKHGGSGTTYVGKRSRK